MQPIKHIIDISAVRRIVIKVSKLHYHIMSKKTGITVRGYPYSYIVNQIVYSVIACWIATATATVAPTIGLLPIPRKPIISTCAGTEEEPAN
jgi:hypothetical protein